MNHANADGLSRIPSTLANVAKDEQWITPTIKREFRNQQKNDAVTSLIIEWLNKAERPDEDEMERNSRELRDDWARFNALLMKDEILGLFNNSDDGGTTTFRAIVPKRARQRILELAHSSAGGENFVIHKTVNKLKQRYHWNRMPRGVRDWCEKCLTYNRHKAQQQNRAPIQPIYTGDPFERVAMDIIKPLPKTDCGNRYILTVVDHLTKHVEAYAQADQEAMTVARVFLNEFLSLYGFPYVLHTDQGANFKLNLFKEFC